VLLGSVINFRDLGGKRGLDGRRVVAGRLFRTGDLSMAQEADARALAARFALSLYCDFRTPFEVGRVGRPTPLENAGVRWQPMPIASYEDPEFARISHPTPADWAQHYVRLIHTHRATYVAFLEALAAAPGPVVFGCAAGKDRTGLAAAALLTCLGVDEAQIIADYAETSRSIEPHIDRYERYWAKTGRSRAEMVAHYFIAAPEIMTLFLAAARSRWGGLEPALALHQGHQGGLTPGLVDSLRARYLDPVDVESR
jgi:protein-tyrosine phosphatase